MAWPSFKPMPEQLEGFDYIPIGVIWKDGRWQTLKWHSPDSAQAKRDENNKYAKGMVLIAPTRSGKLTSLIAMTLAGFNYGSYIAADMKGELAWYSVPCRRAMGHECHVLNPFALHTDRADYMKTSRVNRLAELDPNDEFYSVDLDGLADSTLREVKGKDPFWQEGARNIWRNVMDAARRWRDDISVPDVAEMVSPAQWRNTLHICAASSSLGARNIAELYDPDGPEKKDGTEGQLHTLRTQTEVFYEIEPIRKLLSGKPDFRWGDVKRKNMSVFIVWPDGMADRYSVLTRHLLGSAIGACIKLPYWPAFIEADEIAHVFGHQPLDIFPVAFNAAAYAGLRIRAVFHNVEQGVGLLGREQFNSLLSGAGLVQFFTPGIELATPKLISEFAGETSKLKVDPLNPERREWVQVPIWYPQDIRGMNYYLLPDGTTRSDVRWQCVLREGEALPLVAGRMNWWHPYYQGFYTARMQERLDAHPE